MLSDTKSIITFGFNYSRQQIHVVIPSYVGLLFAMGNTSPPLIHVRIHVGLFAHRQPFGLVPLRLKASQVVFEGPDQFCWGRPLCLLHKIPEYHLCD